MTMIIDGTLGLEFPDGSDQTVAYTGNASTITTGVLATANGGTGATSYVATQWTTSGANISYTTGNVGIGTASPGVALDVRRSTIDGAIAEFHQSTGYGIDIGSSESIANISSGFLQSLALRTDAGSGQTERMRITSAGDVGIGVTSPATKFEVQKSGVNSLFRNANSTATTTYITVVNANNTTNGLVAAHINDGTGYFGTQNNAALRLVTGDVERMRLTTNGAVAFSGASNFGSSGQLLQSNGDAAPTWVTASSIGVGQSWTNVGGSRSSGTTYTNSTGRAIQLMVATDNTGNTNYGSGGSAKFFINGNNVGEAFCSNAANVGGLFQAIIPPSSTYQVSASIIRSWWELR